MRDHRVTPTTPRWDCRDEKDIERLEVWTNAQLDAMYELQLSRDEKAMLHDESESGDACT
jgi:hypothetical protein